MILTPWAPDWAKHTSQDFVTSDTKFKCQGNWFRTDDLLPHPNSGDDDDQPESLPGHGLPPGEAQHADQGSQGVKEVNSGFRFFLSSLFFSRKSIWKI